MTITVGSLCSGYEATSLGLHLAGWHHRLAFAADPDPAATEALAHHHPDVPNLGDISEVRWTDVEPVDLLTMGFPCQSVSCAGSRAGLGDTTRSGVWTHCAEAIAALRPPLVLIENVPGILSTPANRSTDATDSDLEPPPPDLGDGHPEPVLRALGAVLGDLATLRYDTVRVCVSAADIGAPHLRKRIFILAWPVGGEDEARRLLTGIGEPVLDPDGCGGLTGALLPTPNAALGRGTGTPSPETARDRFDQGKRFLDDAVALLPTPRARDHKGRDPNPRGVDLNQAIALLPTPGATDGTNGGPNQRGSSGDLMLPSAVMLLPTPTVMHTARNATSGRTNPKPDTNTNGWTLADIAFADRWGDYAPAIARWEQVTGWPAPDPTEAGSKGQPRLAPTFVEWMQGLPAGHVTAVPGVSRNDALKLLGNSNPPQMYAAAIRQLAAIVVGLLIDRSP